MDVRFVNPFINATLSILEELTSNNYTAGKPYLKEDDLAKGDISGIIGLTGEAHGTVSITFDKNIILEIVSAMFDEKIEEINEEVIDAAGELNNMITGRAINELTENGINLDLSVPSIIHGPNHTIKHFTDGPKIAVPFITNGGKFTIEISLDK